MKKLFTIPNGRGTIEIAVDGKFLVVAIFSADGGFSMDRVPDSPAVRAKYLQCAWRPGVSVDVGSLGTGFWQEMAITRPRTRAKVMAK